MPLQAHKLIHDTAVEIANTHFETFARDNRLYRALLEAWAKYDPVLRTRVQRDTLTREGARALFVARSTQRFYEEARQALTALLLEPDDRVPISVKDKIEEALILDNPCRGNRIVAEVDDMPDIKPIFRMN